MNKNIITAIIVSLILIILALIFSGKGREQETKKQDSKEFRFETPINNVSIKENKDIKNTDNNESGKQIIEINAKGGYFPQRSIAKAGIPTIVRFVTKGTFDCSSFVRIPSLNISKNLAQSGYTDIDLGVQEKGVLYGSCSMGMYPFEIDFQ